MVNTIDPSRSMMVKSFCHVLVVSVSMTLFVLAGYFDSAYVETGLDHYAEKPYWGMEDRIPSWLPMPANTIVNLGYILVGLHWIVKVKRIRQTASSFGDGDAYMFYAFSWMAVAYGFIQCGRILKQNRILAVLDQWYTLPIFAWVTAWSYHTLNGWSSTWMLSIVSVSISSYGLALFLRYGFEITLFCHILVAVACAIMVYHTYPSHKTLLAFYKAIICCVGFVCLKLLDGTLPGWSGIFAYLSGHFWSKIADFLQIHYACLFFCRNLHAD